MEWIPVEKSLPPLEKQVLLHATVSGAFPPVMAVGKVIIEDSELAWIMGEEIRLSTDKVKAWCPIPLSPEPSESMVHYHYGAEWGIAADYFACNTDPNRDGPHSQSTNWNRVTCPECLKNIPACPDPGESKEISDSKEDLLRYLLECRLKQYKMIGDVLDHTRNALKAIEPFIGKLILDEGPWRVLSSTVQGGVPIRLELSHDNTRVVLVRVDETT
jgi:hypothetical protein